MVEYTKIDCKLTNVQLNKLKKAVESNEGATLRLSINESRLPLAKNVLAPLGLTAAMSSIDGSIKKENSWFSG